MKDYFKVGTVNKRLNRLDYIVKSQKDLETIIIPHFVKYPLFGEKLESFLLFQYIVEITKRGNTRARPANDYLSVLVAMYLPRENEKKSQRKYPKEQWLKELQNNYPQNFLNFNFDAFEKNFYNRFLEKRNRAYQECIEKKLSSHYILGLVQGDGCFSPLTKTEKPRFVFVISFLLDPQNRKLAEKLKDFFDAGYIFESPKDEKSLTFRVQDLLSIRNKIIPFFSKPENQLGFRKGKSFDFFKNYFFENYSK